MKFEYQLTRKHLADFNAYYYWKNKILSAIFSAIVTGAFFFIFLSSHRNFTVERGLLCSGIFIAIYLFSIHLGLKKTGKYYRENGPTLARKEIELTDKYFMSSDSYGESKTAWASFTHLETGKHSIYLFIESMTAIIIPKTIFADERSCQQFIDYINERLATTSQAQ
ncbi:MAG: YcxB family protein [Chitinophagaceae bacterium]